MVKSLRNWAMEKARKAETRGRLEGGTGALAVPAVAAGKEEETSPVVKTSSISKALSPVRRPPISELVSNGALPLRLANKLSGPTLAPNRRIYL